VQLDLCLPVPSSHEEVPARKQPGMALAVIFHPASLVAQREPAAIGELDLEDRSILDCPSVEDVSAAETVAWKASAYAVAVGAVGNEPAVGGPPRSRALPRPPRSRALPTSTQARVASAEIQS